MVQMILYLLNGFVGAIKIGMFIIGILLCATFVGGVVGIWLLVASAMLSLVQNEIRKGING